MKKAALILVLILILAGGGWYWWSSKSGVAGGPPGMGMGGMGGGMPPMPVSFVEVKSEKIALLHQLPARVSPFRQSQVRPQVDGIVTERLFEEGADVEKGQQLYQIDDARYKAALNSAIADLKSAQANVKAVEAREARYEELVKAGAVSKQEYDDVKAEFDKAVAAVAVAQAAVDVAQVNLGYTKVYAPISGRISRSFVTEGALVTANQSQYLAVITQLDPVYIDMQQSGVEAIQLRSQMMGKDAIPVSLTLDESTGTTYAHTGALKFSEVTVDETAGSITLRAVMPNPDGVLLPGLFVRATLDLGQEEALLVPQRAAIRAPDGSLMVWVVDEHSQAQPRPIQVGSAYQDNWVVASGLNPGDKVIVEGYIKVGPGAPVVPAPWTPGAGSIPGGAPAPPAAAAASPQKAAAPAAPPKGPAQKASEEKAENAGDRPQDSPSESKDSGGKE